MSIRNVMVYVDLNQQAEGHVHVAEVLAKRFDASIIGVCARAIEPPFVAEGVVIEETTAADLRQMKRMLADKGLWFRKILGRPSEKVHWRWSVGSPTAFLVSESRAADLVVLKRDQRGHDAFHDIDPATVMLQAGRPVLLVPDGVTELAADGIVVGWKDAREARVAVQQALPLLTRASRVTVVELCRSDEQDAARARVQDVSNFLQSHSVKCRSEIRVHSSELDASYLARLARQEKADLIVTGGYGHSRLGEWIFGGLTRDLLRDTPICLLMSH